MYEIKTLNKIAKIGMDCLGDACVHNDDTQNPDAILVRSADMHEMDFPASLKAIGRAGAGVNNIPLDKCSEQGIVVFNTPGANANAVKELVIAGILLSCRKTVDAIAWGKTLVGTEGVAKAVEKGKSQFVGPEIKGKTLGVIGLGAIGAMVANAAESLGMEVIGYDPFISVDAAWSIRHSVKKAADMNEIFQKADFISLHVPQNDSTKGMINAESFAIMKDGVRIVNFARAGLVNDDDMEAALKSGKVACYVTDFPNEKTVAMEGVIAIPHLGASTPESEDNCAVMAAKQVRNYLVEGNIVNSVNFPECTMPCSSSYRLCVMHHNIPNMLGSISSAIADCNINISNMLNKSRGEVAYTILDLDAELPESVLDTIKASEGVVFVRSLKF